ncbi:MAG: hypothetical protein KDA85_22720, partial [Planctomycetaceae bacterium]|nr:hypothetical protein [Planctomycetaceae bacterium]
MKTSIKLSGRAFRRRRRTLVSRGHSRRVVSEERKGSVLVIVLALLSLLAFTGMVFYTFSAQERDAAEYFSEAAKAEVNDPDDPFKWPLRQMIQGPDYQEVNSIVWSPDARHSLVRQVVGTDLSPHSGHGISMVVNDTNGQSYVDLDHDGEYSNAGDNPSTDPIYDLRNVVDSTAAWASGVNTYTNKSYSEQEILQARSAARNTNLPAADVPYTYPDVNNLLLGYRGWAIRDNGASATPRYQRVEVYIPSGVRPSLLKSSKTNGPGSKDTIVDVDWWDDSAHPQYAYRSLRAHPSHMVFSRDASGKIISTRRFLDATEPTDAALISSLPGGSGAFPFRPGESTKHTANFGHMGILTGHEPDDYELDSDNDRDPNGI